MLFLVWRLLEHSRVHILCCGKLSRLNRSFCHCSDMQMKSLKILSTFEVLHVGPSCGLKDVLAMIGSYSGPSWFLPHVSKRLERRIHKTFRLDIANFDSQLFNLIGLFGTKLHRLMAENCKIQNDCQCCIRLRHTLGLCYFWWLWGLMIWQMVS